MVGETFDRVSVKHLNFDPADVINASYEIIDSAPQVAENVKEFKGVHLNEDEKLAYATACLPLLYDEAEAAPIRPERLLYTRRSSDYGNDLWKTFNAVQ